MKEMLKFGFLFIKKGWYVIYIFLYGISSICAVILPWIMGEIIDAITLKTGKGFLINNVLFYALLALLCHFLTALQNHIYLKLEAQGGYYSNIELIQRLYHTDTSKRYIS